MSKIQLREFINQINNVTTTKRIGSCPWGDIEAQQQVVEPPGIDNFHARNDALSQSESKEANHSKMEEDYNGLSILQTRPPEVSCRELVPYMRPSEHAHNHPTFHSAPVAGFNPQDMEVMLFAIQVAVAAHAQHVFNRKRLFNENQNEGDLHRPPGKIPKQQRDSLFETSCSRLVSFQCQLETSRSNETGTVHESCQERAAFDEAISDGPVYESNNIDVESKAQRKKRKEEKRKRRDQKLAKKQHRMERESEEQSKRAREDPIYDESREKISVLAAETSETPCCNMESENHDLLPDDTGGKRRKMEAPTRSLNGPQPGGNIKQPPQSLAEKRSGIHTNLEQRPRLPLGTKVSSIFSFFGRPGAALTKQEKPSDSRVDHRYEVPQSQPPVLKQAFVREQPIGDTAKKASSSALRLVPGLANHQKSNRQEIHSNAFANNEVESAISRQGEPPNWEAIDFAKEQDPVQNNFIAINEEPAPDPIQVLCTESFLGTWGDLVCAITSSQWPRPYSSVPAACPREIRFIDSPLLDGCGVDLELSQRGALLLYCTSVLDEEAAARGIVVALAELVAANRYVYIYVLLIHDIATTPNISLSICRLQNAVLQHGRQPPTRVIFKTSTTASLPESLANIITSRETSHTASSKLSYEDFLENTHFCQQACFLRRLVPSLSGNGAIQCLKLAHALTSADCSFSLILTSKAMREQIIRAVTSSPSRAPEISPDCMNQLSVLVSTRVGP